MSETVKVRRIPAARWWDSRLLLGVLLVLVSVVIGTRVVASADDTTPVWVSTQPLAAGAVVQDADVEVTHVRLDDASGRYVGTDGDSPVGHALARPIGAGELVPVAAIADDDRPSDHRLVTVPVEPFHHPSDLARGELVDVYVTVDGDTPGATTEPVRVLAEARVDRVEEPGASIGSGGVGVGVVLAVDPDDVPDVVGAVQRGAIDLVRIPGGAQ